MCTAVVPVDSLEGAVERGEPVRVAPLGAGLHVRLVELHDVGARGEQVASTSSFTAAA